VFTARYVLGPHTEQIRFLFKLVEESILNQVVDTTFSSRVKIEVVNLTNSGFLSHSCRCYVSLVSRSVKNKATVSVNTSSFPLPSCQCLFSLLFTSYFPQCVE
jgi:hypothetical protein